MNDCQVESQHDCEDAKQKRRLERCPFRPCSTNFNMDYHFLSFLTTNGFFAEMSRNIHKMPTRDVPFAGVGFDRREDAFVLYWNPDAFSSWSPEEVQAVLYHEFFHVVFGHLGRCTGTSMDDIINIAQDLAINSLIEKMRSEGSSAIKMKLPGFTLNPGILGTKVDGSAWSAEELLQKPLVNFIHRLPPGKTSQEYLQALLDSNIPGTLPQDGLSYENTGFMIDTHDNSNSDIRDYVSARMDVLITKAANFADSTGNWGNMPADVKQSIRDYVRHSVDWRKVLERFVGYSMKSHKRKTITRINKRYPYIHAGKTSSTRARLLIAIDQSGSVSMEMLIAFYSALASLTAHIEVDYLPFDCSADIADVVTWKKGSLPQVERIKQGGTNFNAPTAIVNDPVNRSRWDALLILTDGEASAPMHCAISRGWVLPKGCKLHFNTNETKIIVDGGRGLREEF